MVVSFFFTFFIPLFRQFTPSLKELTDVFQWRLNKQRACGGALASCQGGTCVLFPDRDQWVAECALILQELSSPRLINASLPAVWAVVLGSAGVGLFVFLCPNYGTINTLPGTSQ